MGKELSAGFDIAAVFSEETINRIFRLTYFAGLLPMHASTSFQHATGEHTLELYFSAPTLQFVSIPDVNNPVELRFPFLAHVSTMNAQGAGAIVVFCTASKLQDLDQSDEPFNYVILDFTTVPVEQYQFQPGSAESPQAALPPAAATTFEVLAPSLVESVAAPLAKNVLKNGIENIPITPKVPSSFGFFTFRLHVDSSFVLPSNGTPYALPRVLGAYVNLGNDSASPPAKAPVELWQHIEPHPHNASYIWSGVDEMRIALPETLVMSKLGDALIEKGLKPLPATLTFGETEVTLNSLHVALGNGHLLVTGDADDVDFTLKIKLRIENDQLQSIVVDKDFDVPWYLDFLQAILPGIGSAIVQAIRLAVAKGLDSVGGLTGDLLGDVNIFANDLPGLALAPLRIRNNGDISISPGGFVLPGQLEPLLDGSDVEQPFYVYGHLHSHEFHRKGMNCPYLEKLKPQNTILFLSPAKALSMGYNGCRHCYLDYDAATAGRILLHFRDLAAGPDAESVKRKVDIHFRLLAPVVVGDQEVQPDFELKRAYDGHVKEDGHLYFSDLGLADFLPGTWEMSIQSGSWSTTCDVVVKKWGNHVGKNTHVALTVGVQGCSQAFGDVPSFPEP